MPTVCHVTRHLYDETNELTSYLLTIITTVIVIISKQYNENREWDNQVMSYPYYLYKAIKTYTGCLSICRSTLRMFLSFNTMHANVNNRKIMIFCYLSSFSCLTNCLYSLVILQPHFMSKHIIVSIYIQIVWAFVIILSTLLVLTVQMMDRQFLCYK